MPEADRNKRLTVSRNALRFGATYYVDDPDQVVTPGDVIEVVPAERLERLERLEGVLDDLMNGIDNWWGRLDRHADPEARRELRDLVDMANEARNREKCAQ